MRIRTVLAIFAMIPVVFAVAATASAQDGSDTVLTTKAELDKLGARYLADELRSGQMLFKAGSRYYAKTTYLTPTKFERAQIHTQNDQIILILGGTAELTLGNELEGKFAQKGHEESEFRGTGIKGGTVRQVVEGDIINITRGTPHMIDNGKGYIYFLDIQIPGK